MADVYFVMHFLNHPRPNPKIEPNTRFEVEHIRRRYREARVPGATGAMHLKNLGWGVLAEGVVNPENFGWWVPWVSF